MSSPRACIPSLCSCRLPTRCGRGSCESSTGPMRPERCSIYAIDDSGEQADPVELSLDCKAQRGISIRETWKTETPPRGLTGKIGSGQGNWRLKLETDLDIEPLAYIRTPADGFLTSMHDVAQGESMRWLVPIFNPGSNPDQKSLLRVINTSGIDTDVVVEGLDDEGTPAPDGDVRFTLSADAAVLFSAQHLVPPPFRKCSSMAGLKMSSSSMASSSSPH